VDGCLGRRADTAPRDGIGERVALNADQFPEPARQERRPSPRCGPQARDQTAGTPVESPGTVIPAGCVTSLAADAVPMASVADAAAAARTAAYPARQATFSCLLFMVVLPDLGRRLVRGPHS